MLKKKKTTASDKLVLVKSVRRHWTSGGCPLSADRSGTETAQPQNEILCSIGAWGHCPQQADGRKCECVLTLALLASRVCGYPHALLACIIPNSG